LILELKKSGDFMKSRKQKNGMDRRSFLNKLGASAGIAATLPAISLLSNAASAYADDIGPQGGRQRAQTAEDLRVHVAEFDGNRVPIPNHPDNGDEDLYPSHFASYSKCLKHNPTTGEVDPAAYDAFIGALRTGQFSDFEALVTNGHFGSTDPSKQRRLVNPISAYDYDLEGIDSHQFKLPPPPKFNSAQRAGEMVELYWMTVLRDVEFSSYATDATAAAACLDLSKLSDFRGPKSGGQVTPQTLFRDSYRGCLDGPYVSQFLLKPVQFGSQLIDTRVQNILPGTDYMTTFQDWLDVQNGIDTPAAPYSGTSYLDEGRDLGHYVHIDALFQAYFVACLHLLGGGYLANDGNPYGKVIDGGAGRHRNAAIDPNGCLSMVGFGTFGAPQVLTMVCEASTRALKNEWYQKWLVHRNLRPEEFGGRVEAMRLGKATYPFHAELLNSGALSTALSKFGTALQTQAYPEGSPNHPSYASGHATVAGASVTILKALFDGSQVIKNPMVPNPADHGVTLIPYVAPAGEPPLTVEGELNKLASNVSQGRNIAGVHWRTDANAANLLGEGTAISMLRDAFHMYREPFKGYTFNKFDGTSITA
jgi:hypothetical protein